MIGKIENSIKFAEYYKNTSQERFTYINFFK